MNLTIPCETQAREFDAKLLLSCFAAERGHHVVVGSKKAINARIARFPRSVYVSKSLTNRNLLMYGLLERLGHTIVCGDEEGLVYASPESYLHHKVAAQTLQKADALLAWGEENAKIWREFDGFHGVPIYVTGNARVDLLRPELRELFRDDVDRLRARHAPFILVNTNFSRLNHYFPGQSRQANKLREAAEGTDVSKHPDLGLAAHKSVLFRYFLEMIPALARACPGHTIVVRPHPSEKRETWQQAAGGLTNVTVLHEGNVVPWILAADLLIHNGCTTAVEAYLLGKPAIAYQPATSEDFDLQLPNLLSHRAFDLDSLLSATLDHLGGRLAPAAEEADRQRELISRYVEGREGAFASERIVDSVEAFLAEGAARSGPGVAERAAARLGARVRGFVQRCEAHIPGHHNNAVYLRHMFPGATVEQVRERVATYGRLLGRFDRVHVRATHENIFEVTT
jgi:surface carbohydrate biosynthesis protein